MTVAELITILQKMPQDHEVFMYDIERTPIVEVQDVGDCVDLYPEDR